MSKRIVEYDPTYPVEIFVGIGALVKPINHPDKENVSNEKMVLTSPVVAHDGGDCFETQNSIYVPHVKKKDLN